MPYNDFVSRADATALIPTETSGEIISDVAKMNPVMSLATRLADMPSGTSTMPVTSALATAYFVNGDTGLKQTTDMTWASVNIHAEEVAAIVPIPEAVLADSRYPIWANIRPQLAEAVNVAITNAVMNGTNIPATWTTDLGAAGLFARATAAGHVISAAAYADDYEAILGETAAGVDGLYMLLEADGFMPTGNIAHAGMKGRLRNLRDVNGNPIFKALGVQGPTNYELDGTPMYFPTDGTVPAATYLMAAGDWKKLVYSIRQDMTYKILDQAVIQDGAGNIVFNLAQQDMVALRVVIRLGFALPNPINRMNATAATRCPFAFLTA